MTFTRVSSSIPFVASIQIECGFVIPSGTITLPKTLFLDTHCIHCYKTILDGTNSFFNEIPIFKSNINAYILCGALHYNMRFGGFIRQEKLTTASPNSIANLSSIQSICINNIIAYDQTSDFSDSSDSIINSYIFTPQFLMFKLYTDKYLKGIDLYSDINSSTLTKEAMDALSYPTGCKSIVASGYINLIVKN